MSWACRKPLSHATKSYRVNRPLHVHARGSNPALTTAGLEWSSVVPNSDLSCIVNRQLVVSCHFGFQHLRDLRTVPTNSKVFLPRFMIMREMKTFTSVIEIEKEIGCNHAFFTDSL